MHPLSLGCLNIALPERCPEPEPEYDPEPLGTFPEPVEGVPPASSRKVRLGVSGGQLLAKDGSPSHQQQPKDRGGHDPE